MLPHPTIPMVVSLNRLPHKPFTANPAKGRNGNAARAICAKVKFIVKSGMLT